MSELPKIKIEMKATLERHEGAVREHMGDDASYLVLPRVAMQCMPVWWQKIFVWLISMLPSLPEYNVQRRATNGRFEKDPWADYRKGDIAGLLAMEQGWKITQGRTCKCQNQQKNC